ncbi:MAG TPA: response regulator [bacterium]|jgi:two-component system response regulator|nr:response regulator [bacterium]
MRDEKVILLVDDSPDDRDLTLRALEKNKILNRVVCAVDGVEALDILLGRGAHAGAGLAPTLMLLDLKLPKVDGLQVLRTVRAEPKTQMLPVVILTSSKEEQDLVASYRLGANSYIRKPVDFNKFTEAVRQLGLYWLMLNEAPPSGPVRPGTREA